GGIDCFACAMARGRADYGADHTANCRAHRTRNGTRRGARHGAGRSAHAGTHGMRSRCASHRISVLGFRLSVLGVVGSLLVALVQFFAGLQLGFFVGRIGGTGPLTCIGRVVVVGRLQVLFVLLVGSFRMFLGVLIFRLVNMLRRILCGVGADVGGALALLVLILRV